MYDPITDSAWPAEIEALRDGFAGRLNVYRVMAHHPALLAAWVNFRNHVVLHSALGNEDLEVVILRAGWQLGAAYEVAHHILRGRAAGLSDRRIAALCSAESVPVGDDAVLARAVDELIADAQLSEDTLRMLTQRLGPKGVLDLMATLGHYTTLAYIVKTFATPLDADIAAALAARPLQP